MAGEIRVDKIADLRDIVTYRIMFHSVNGKVNEIDASTLVGSSASLGTAQLSFKAVHSSIQGHLSITCENTVTSSSSLIFCVGSGHTNVTLDTPIASNLSQKSSVYNIETDTASTGFAYITFQKTSGFENVGIKRRKPLKPNPYG